MGISMFLIVLAFFALNFHHMPLKTEDLSINGSTKLAKSRSAMTYQLQPRLIITPTTKDDPNLGGQLYEDFTLRVGENLQKLRHIQLRNQIRSLINSEGIADLTNGVHNLNKEKDSLTSLFCVSAKDTDDFIDSQGFRMKLLAKNTEGKISDESLGQGLANKRSHNKLAQKGNNPNVRPSINSNYFTENGSHIGNYCWNLILFYGILITALKFIRGPLMLLVLIGCLCVPGACQLSSFTNNQYYYDSSSDFCPDTMGVGSDYVYIFGPTNDYNIKCVLAPINSAYSSRKFTYNYGYGALVAATVTPANYLVVLIVNQGTNYDRILVFKPDSTLYKSFSLPRLTMSSIPDPQSTFGYDLANMNNENFVVVGGATSGGGSPTQTYAYMMEMSIDGDVLSVYSTYYNSLSFSGAVNVAGRLVAIISSVVYIFDYSSGFSLRTNFTNADFGMQGTGGGGNYIYLTGYAVYSGNTHKMISRFNLESNSIDFTKEVDFENANFQSGLAVAYSPSANIVAILAIGNYVERIIVTDEVGNVVNAYAYTGMSTYRQSFNKNMIRFVSSARIVFTAMFNNGGRLWTSLVMVTIFCDKGNYLSGSTCVSCSAGTYSTVKDSPSCSTCGAGSYSGTGASSCTSCGTGTYQTNSGQPSCSQCNQGYYNPSTGSISGTACVQCEAGKYQGNPGQGSCLSCSTGTFSSAGASSCTPCSTGTYQNVTGQTICLNCSVGYYAPSTNTVDCTICPTGSYQDVSGSTNYKPCPVGTFANITGLSVCYNCSPGKYQSSTSQTSCLDTPVGSYTDAQAATAYIPCPQGYYQNLTAQASCVICPIGTYQTLTGKTSCDPCAIGSANNVPGLTTVCPACLPGTYQPSTGKYSCIDCDPGSFQASSSASGCTVCPAGKYQPLSGKSSCSDCASGHYQDQTGKTSCIACSAGNFVSGLANTACSPCSVGTYQDQAGQSSCALCSLGTYQNLQQQTSCIKCSGGLVASTTGLSICAACSTGWNSSVAHDKCLYKGLFDTLADFQAHTFSQKCFGGSAIIKPFSFDCRKSFMTLCCNGSAISSTTNCNLALDLQPGDKEYDAYCVFCAFIVESACPPPNLCWNDVLDTLSTNYSLSCLENLAPYCSSKLMLNPNDTECLMFTNSCNSIILNSTYGPNLEKFTITFSRRLPTTLPSCNTIFDLTKSTALIQGKFTCTRTSDYTIDVNISALPLPVKSYYLANSILKDACGVYIPSAALQNVIPPDNLGVAQIEGSTTDKCMGLTINSTIRKDYTYSILMQFWKIEYTNPSDAPEETTNRIKNLGNVNKTIVSIAYNDLYTGKTLKISLTVTTPYGVNITSNQLSITVPGITSGKAYCGPCQLDDRSSCKNYDTICWNSYLDGAVTNPFNTTTCLKAMAKKCYEIWTTSKLSINDSQCLYFKQYYNLTLMQSRPNLAGAFYSSDGKTITVTFGSPIYTDDFIDCSGLFSASTLKWFPESKSGKWLNKTALQVNYDPQVGILKTLTLLGNVLHNEYVYSQECVNETTIPITLPPLETVLKISGISTVSECDSIKLNAVLVTPSLFKLVFKWEISYDYSTLDKKVQEDLKALLSKYSEYSYQSVFTLSSQYLVRGTTIKVSLSAKVGEYESNTVSTSSDVKIVGDAIAIQFTSKSQLILELDGSKNSQLSLDVSNKKCAKDNSDTNMIPVSVEFQVASGKSPTDITTITDEENRIATEINRVYKTNKMLMVGASFGFNYLKYYNITATVKDLLSGTTNFDTIGIRLLKPEITAVIDPIGTLVSTAADIEFNGGNSLIPVSTDDTIEYRWKCSDALSFSLGGSCSCPYLNDNDILNSRMIVPKGLIKNLCKYVFSLTVSATNGDFRRSARSSIEFFTYPGAALPLKGMSMKGSNDKITDVYFTFTLPQLTTAPKDSEIPFQWSLVEVKSENPSASTYYSTKNTFIYDFFLSNLKQQVDPQIKKNDTQIPTTLNPTYLTQTNVRVLGIDRNSLLVQHRYTFGVIISYPNSPTFLFVDYLTPPLPRTRDIIMTQTSGIGFDTEFKIMFNLPFSTDSDEARYQILRSDGGNNSTEVNAVTQQISRANSQTLTLAPGLQSSDYQVDLIVRAFEYDSKIDMKTTITVVRPKSSVSEVLKSQRNKLNGSNSYSIEQVFTLLNQMSSLSVTESTNDGKDFVKFIVDLLSTTSYINGGIMQTMNATDKMALISAGTVIISLLTTKQQTNVDIDSATMMKNVIDNYLAILQNCESGSSLVPSMITALSGLADIGIKEQYSTSFYKSMSNSMSKMADIMIKDMPVGGLSRIVESQAINIVCVKSYMKDFDNNQTFNTPNNASIGLPGNLQEQMINNLCNQLNHSSNTSIANSTISVGASLRATTFNTFDPIKSNSAIDKYSLSNSSSSILNPDTIEKIYNDIAKEKYKDLVDLKGLESDLLHLTLTPFEFQKNATEKLLTASTNIEISPKEIKAVIKTSTPIGLLPKDITMDIRTPAKFNADNYFNNTIMVPLYYQPDTKKWSNKNCSLTNPEVGDTLFNIVCNRVGSQAANVVDSAIDFTVDVIKDLFKVLDSGNYQELANVQALVGYGVRNLIAYAVIVGVVTYIVFMVLFMAARDKHALYEIKCKVLLEYFNKEEKIPSFKVLDRIIEFLIQAKRTGLKKVSKKTIIAVHPEQAKVEVEAEAGKKAKKLRKPVKVCANGLTKFSAEESESLKDLYDLFSQCSNVYDEEEIEGVLSQEVADNVVLHRLTKSYIDEEIIRKPISFWTLLKVLFKPVICSSNIPSLVHSRELK